eukprot:gene22799-biopygen19283
MPAPRPRHCPVPPMILFWGKKDRGNRKVALDLKVPVTSFCCRWQASDRPGPIVSAGTVLSLRLRSPAHAQRPFGSSVPWAPLSGHRPLQRTTPTPRSPHRTLGGQCTCPLQSGQSTCPHSPKGIPFLAPTPFLTLLCVRGGTAAHPPATAAGPPTHPRSGAGLSRRVTALPA